MDDHNILWLEVPVDYAILMNVPESLQDDPGQFLCLGLVQISPQLFQITGQIVPPDVLKDEIERVEGLPVVDQPDHVWVLDGLQYPGLLFNQLDLLTAQLPLQNLLVGLINACLFVLDQKYSREFPLTNLLNHLISIDFVLIGKPTQITLPKLICFLIKKS